MSEVKTGKLCYVCVEIIEEQDFVSCNRCTFLVHAVCLARTRRKSLSSIRAQNYMCQDCKKKKTEFFQVDSILSHRFERERNMSCNDISYEVVWSNGKSTSVVRRNDLGYCQNILADYWKKLKYKDYSKEMAERGLDITNHICVIGRGISLWQSQLPSMDGTLNLGLFATRDFWPGQPLTYYEGEFISFDTAKSLRQKGQAGYVRSIWFGSVCVDGLRDSAKSFGRGGGSFINHAKESSTNARYYVIEYSKFYNMTGWDKKKFRSYGNGLLFPVIIVKATRFISKGSEILASYGDRSFQLDHVPTSS